MRRQSSRQLAAVLVISFTCTSTISFAIDEDTNGIDDAVELQLAKQFCPSFILHLNRGVEPEPVEILSGGQPLLAENLRIERWNVNGDRIDDLTWTEAAFSELWGFSNIYYFMHYYLHTLPNMFIHNPHGPLPYYYYFVLHHEFGPPDAESSGQWAQQYGPIAASHPPTVYAHLFRNGPTEHVIQYWMFYPYNAWINDHEGDWEHINVVLTSGNPQTAEISRVQYYFHKKYVEIQGSLLNNLYLLEGAHPVVFIGGHGNDTCYYHNSGNVSGASYPAPGSWIDVSDLNLPGCTDPNEGVLLGGKLISHDDVNVTIIPEVSHIDEEDYWVVYHRDRQWMKANIPWGHVETPTVEEWVERWPFNVEDVGNDAPPGPAYSPDWNRLFGSQGYGEPLTNVIQQGPAIFLLGEVQTANGDVSSHAIQFTLDTQATVTPAYKMVHPNTSGAIAATVTMPATTVKNGETFFFSHWSDGSLVRSRTLSFTETTTLRARYRAGFFDVTASAGLPSISPSLAAVGDFDNDQQLDLFTVGANRCHLFHNNGDNTFTDVSSSVLFTSVGNITELACADYDNDGLLDVFLSIDGQNRLLKNLGANAFIVTTGAAMVGGGPGSSVAWGDHCISDSVALPWLILLRYAGPAVKSTSDSRYRRTAISFFRNVSCPRRQCRRRR